jgi:hypothetical protein
MTKNNIVIYSALFGERGQITEPSYIPIGCDFVFFTDRTDLRSSIWNIKQISQTIPGDSVRSARSCKVLAHKYVPEYEYSIWIDANLEVIGDAVKLFNQYIIERGQLMVSFNHANNKDSRDCVYDELEALLEANRKGRFRDDPILMQNQVSRYSEAGYPRHNGLAVTMVLMRKHNDPLVIQSMENWWDEIKTFSRRDQLSFNYVAWKNKLPVAYLPGDSRDNPYFKYHPHIKKSLWRRALKQIL